MSGVDGVTKKAEKKKGAKRENGGNSGQTSLSEQGKEQCRKKGKMREATRILKEKNVMEERGKVPGCQTLQLRFRRKLKG